MFTLGQVSLKSQTMGSILFIFSVLTKFGLLAFFRNHKLLNYRNSFCHNLHFLVLDKKDLNENIWSSMTKMQLIRGRGGIAQWLVFALMNPAAPGLIPGIPREKNC